MLCAAVEIAGRLVGEQHRRLVGERAGDGHALLLAAGKLVGRVVAALGEADGLKRLQRPLVLAGAFEPLAPVKHRQLDVFNRRMRESKLKP